MTGNNRDYSFDPQDDVTDPELPFSNEYERERDAFLKEMTQKNSPGTIAADFEYETITGEVTTLHNTPAGSEGLILMFYYPDCSHCRVTIERLSADETLSASISEGRLKFMAIAINEDKDDWRKEAAYLPSEWIVGFNTDEIEERDAYWIPDLPALYILYPDYKVKEKDANL